MMKKMKSIYIASLLLCTTTFINAQITVGNGTHSLEISSRISTYYNQRYLKSDENDAKKDRFKLKDAQIKLEGRIGTIWEYQLQVDLADFASDDSDPADPGILDANVTYKGLTFLDVKLGYNKVPYSLSSLVPSPYSAYWQRAQITRGDMFSRRDVGITLSKEMWKNRINVYAGAYTGLGELSLQGENDASGNPELVGRIDVSYPASTKYREIDYVHSPIPLITLGINARYMNKTLPEGEELPEDVDGKYGIKVIDGKKYTYGMDISLKYKGLSGQFEIHQIKGEPQYEDDELFQGYTKEQTDNYFKAGGYYGQLSYFSKKLKSIVSIRYDELNLNDLINGDSKRFNAALDYQLDGFNAMFKIQYFKIMEEESLDKLKWHDQIRIGMMFNL